MKPNPLDYLDLPADWPKTGTLGGRTIDLKLAFETLSYTGLAQITVDIPGEGKVQPWKQLDGLDTFEVPEGTEGLMPREDLESNGITDGALEAWARDKHGIRLDLSKDDTATQSIRADAWRRYLLDTEW